MKKKIMGFLVLVVLLSGCSTSKPTTITIAAAASLENAFEEDIIKLFEEKHQNIKIKGIYDASGKLQTQIEEGLDTDVFISAATKQMDNLVAKKIVEKGKVTDLLENDLVLISSINSKLKLNDFKDISKSSKVALGDPESVPAGQYAKEALTSLNVWQDVSKKASYGTNVTEVLNWVSAQNAEVGVVYASDAKSDDKVKVVAIAPKSALKNKIVYPLGILTKSKYAKEAQEFVDFLKTSEVSDIFKKYDFIPTEK